MPLDQLDQRMSSLGPVFRATSTVATNNTPGFIKVTLASCSPALSFDTTNSRFQPTVAGYYSITGRVGYTTGSYAVVSAIYKNGSNHSAGQSVTNDASNVSDIVYLNGSTDYVELWTYSGTTQNTRTESHITYFSGFLVRAA